MCTRLLVFGICGCAVYNQKITLEQHEWDVKDVTANYVDVKDASDKFIKSMASIMQTTVYRTLNNVELVIFSL